MSEASADHEIVLVTPGDDGPRDPDSCLQTVLPTVSRTDPLLVVTYTHPPDRIHDRVTDADYVPSELGVITANDGIRSTDAASVNGSASAGDPDAMPLTIETTPPGNLTRLGVRITEFLNRWEAVDGRIVLCFDSITVLSQHVQNSTLLRFLHVLTGHLRSIDARGYFLIDPTPLSDSTMVKAKTVVDTVIQGQPAEEQSAPSPPSTNE